jgi:hypothetical protein
MSAAIEELRTELRRFTQEHWAGEPEDVRRLREFSLPPMGNLPCVLYCNFDLFWAGEQLQVVRQAALAGELPLPELTRMASLLLERTAARAGKWEMSETVALIRRAASAFAEWQPQSGRDAATVIEELLIAIDRIQAAVDAIVPWSDLDRSLRLRPAPA